MAFREGRPCAQHVVVGHPRTAMKRDNGPLRARLQIAKDLIPCVISLSADYERNLSLCGHCRIQTLPAWGTDRMGYHGVSISGQTPDSERK